MPISFEGLEYTRYLFKPLDNCETDGCHADVYLPSDSFPKPYPIAHSIHGGGWTTGDTFHIFTGHFKYLLDRGFCVVSTEYRMAPHATLPDYRVDWVDSYKWIVQDLPKILNGTVDGSRVFAFGGSAGGTAVLFLGLDVQTAGVPPPKAIYTLYPAVTFDQLWVEPRETVSYEQIDQLITTLPDDEQRLIKDMIVGPVCTAYNCKNEESRPLTGRRVFYNLARAIKHPFLISCALGEPGPPFSRKHMWLDHVTSSFPPTVCMKALKDAALDPENTQVAYDKLRELGVDTKLVVAEEMQHGDAEGENGMNLHPPREAKYWTDVYNVALDWCIERTQDPKQKPTSKPLTNGSAEHHSLANGLAIPSVSKAGVTAA